MLSILLLTCQHCIQSHSLFTVQLSQGALLTGGGGQGTEYRMWDPCSSVSPLSGVLTEQVYKTFFSNAIFDLPLINSESLLIKYMDFLYQFAVKVIYCVCRLTVTKPVHIKYCTGMNSNSILVS